MSGALSLKPSYYEALKRLTLELAGIKLGGDHAFLIETRLGALARREGFEGLSEMIEELFSQGQTRLAVHVVSALLERDMRFFDDKPSFKAFEDVVLPRLLAAYGGGQIKILSFGCGSGQEAYGYAMVSEDLRQHLPELEFEITAVDYPSWSLRRAEEGRYTHFEIQRGLPIRQLVKYFDRSAEDWIVKDSLRDKVKFKEFHLLSKISSLGEFQVVLFRNSMKRYSPAAKVRILRGLSHVVSPNGYLMLGSEESLNEMNYGFDPIEGIGGVYKKREIIEEPEEIDDGRKKPNGRTTFLKTTDHSLSGSAQERKKA